MATKFPEQHPRLRDYAGEDYRRFWRGPVRDLLHRAECRALRGLLPTTQGWFLDLGCGYGRLTTAYRRPGRKVVLVDYAEHLLQLAREEYADEDTHAIAADAYDLPFRDGVFAAALSIRLLHHIDAPDRFLESLARVLQPRATVALGYSNKRNPLRILRHGSSCLKRDHEQVAELLFTTHPAHFDRLCRNTGLEPDGRRGTGFVDQIARPGTMPDRVLATMPALRLLFGGVERVLDAALGRAGWCPEQIVRLRRSAEQGERAPVTDDVISILRCVDCHAPTLVDDGRGVRCPECGTLYPRRAGILDFRRGAARA